MDRRRIVLTPAAVLAGAAVLAACGPSVAPAVPTPAPRPAPPPAETPAPRVARFTLPAAVPATSYAVRVRTTLERDSSGRTERETLETSARVELTLRRDPRGSLRGTARVDSFAVRAGGGRGALAAGTPPMVATVLADAALDSAILRATVRPPLPNECDRPEAAAVGLVRDLLVRVPQTVTVGERWRDSLATVFCRGGVLMTLRMQVESSAEETEDGDRVLRMRRTITSRLEGSNRTPWRQTDIAGEGRGTQDVRIDLRRGAVERIDGESTLVIRITDGAGYGAREAPRQQQVTQRSTLSARSDGR
jgi:hypothetical protein